MKMWTTVLNVVFLAALDEVCAAKTKRGSYSVQEMNQEFPGTSSGGGDTGGNSFGPWTGGAGMGPSIGPSMHSDMGLSMGSDMSHAMTSAFSGSDSGYMSFAGGPSAGFMMNGNNGHSFGGIDGGFTAVQGEVIPEKPPSIFEYKPPNQGKDINHLPHILPPGGKSVEQLQEEADFSFKKLMFESKENQKAAQEQIKKLKDNYGYGTFGYDGFKSSVKYEPIDLGTHNAIDLGTSIDYTALKGHHGKLKLPVQTVTVTKTLGIHVPEPYPVKQEVPVPAPFPVPHPIPVPHHGSPQYEEIVGHYATEYDDGFGKSSYPSGDSALSKIVRYHENLPRSPMKHFPGQHSQDYSSYHPPSQNYHTTPQELEFLMPPPPSPSYDSHHFSS